MIDRNSLISIYIIFAMVSVGLFGICTFDTIMEPGTVEAVTIIVNKSGGGDYTKIQDAIDAANTNDTIEVRAGTYNEKLIVNKTVKILGSSSSNTSIKGSNTGSVLYITANFTEISGFNITGDGNSNWQDSAILVEGASNTNIHDNILWNNHAGIQVNGSKNNVISNNTCLKNNYGIILREFGSNLVINNTSKYSLYYGIFAAWNSNGNTIIHNYCASNSNSGIECYGSHFNEIANNTLINNQDGLELRQSDSNVIKNNTVDGNTGSGIMFSIKDNSCTIIDNLFKNNANGITLDYDCKSNSIINNTCFDNFDGIELKSQSDSNIVELNNCSQNSNGIIIYGSQDNTIRLNIISYNTKFGFYIDAIAEKNYIYHNTIIFNDRQSTGAPKNYWNNGINEGNYWSDYYGVDNGAGGRVYGDWIGDTNLPHLGNDNYPFVVPDGWLYPKVPVLKDPGVVDTNGIYQINWTPTFRANYYCLEEDDNDKFTSPTIVYEGNNRSYYFFSKENGTYYYRVKGINEFYEGSWSNVEDIIVDLPPGKPTNLKAANLGGNHIMISWDKNPEPDIDGYYLLVNNTNMKSSGPFHTIATIPYFSHHYNLTDVCEETDYYFILIAFDERESKSIQSNVVHILTDDITPPEPPYQLTGVALSDTEIKLSWHTSPSSDIEGYQIMMNTSMAGQTMIFEPAGNTDPKTTTYTVKMLSEKVTYSFYVQAYDEVPNNSTPTEIITIKTLDITPPSIPKGLELRNATNNSIELTWIPNTDPDLVGYYIYRSKYADSSFIQVNPEPINVVEFIDTGLFENTMYYYKLKAVDDANLTSQFSETVSRQTAFDPSPPELASQVFTIIMDEDSIDDKSLNIFEMFIDYNNDPLTIWCSNQKRIEVTIDYDDGKVVLAPQKDWNGKETLIFSASDGIFDDVEAPIEVIVNGVNDPPSNIKIIMPSNNMEYAAGEEFFLSSSVYDPDLPYGDKLSFEWSSSIDGIFGFWASLNYSKLSPGRHTITVTATDIEGESISTSINITVLASSSNNDQSKSQNPLSILIESPLLLMTIIIIIIVIISLVLFLRARSRRKEQTAELTSAPHVPESLTAPPQTSPAIVDQPPPPALPPRPPRLLQDSKDFYSTDSLAASESRISTTAETIREQPAVSEDPGTGEPASSEMPLVESREPNQPQTEQAPVAQETVQLVACPTCGAQIAAYTTPCPGCNTILNW